MIERTFSGERPDIALPAGAIDTQMHMYLPGFPARPGGPPLPEGLPGPDDYRKVMAWLGIERVVITQGNAHQIDNANLLACLGAMGEAARGVAAITDETTDAEMEALHAAGVRGARIMDLPGGAVGLEALEAVDARASAFGWCLAVQFDGTHLLEHVTRLERLKSRYIIDHHGKFFSGISPQSAQVDALRRLIGRGNCWFKFAGCYESSRSGPPHYEDIAAVARQMAADAPERIIWGTNWPHNLARRTQDYPNDAALLDTVLGWVPEDHRTKVLVDNPAALFDF
ncbi:amidohydrolase family protein [Nitratireductor sp. ZSWI3]|uniref:amidohydrolase family protein n=1 Tax=Nitratireductor sp. ZSWI3 TaxID=2966359 RepID=UPI00214FFC73|nr:amidohydrolase family protein [Nitratireductor sp. ZSWI3]MCR4268501.1 amidohydrolase family protein [Nitratireductor sp. ZSWI3]